MATSIKDTINKILGPSGVQIDGPNPWDITVHNDGFYRRLLRSGSIGLGESYMAGEWDCEEIDTAIYKLGLTDLYKYAVRHPKAILHLAGAKVINHARPSKAFEVGRRHYDIGNDLYKAMLDKRMVYTCGYWKDAKNLDEAQEAKLELICRKAGLKKGMRVLDIGGGWGSFAKYAAEKYGVSVVNITVSKEQVKLADELCAGLPVENRLQDYRDVNEKFDRIISIGMFEHVGPKNFKAYFSMARRCLVDDGLFVLHTIGSSEPMSTIDPWMEKYIFPGAVPPALSQITKSLEGKFIVEDVHNFGAYYDTTLLAWNENFEKAWPTLEKEYGETFRRMWRYYLLACAGSFRSRGNELYQFVLSPKGVPGGYQSIR